MDAVSLSVVSAQTMLTAEGAQQPKSASLFDQVLARLVLPEISDTAVAVDPLFGMGRLRSDAKGSSTLAANELGGLVSAMGPDPTPALKLESRNECEALRVGHAETSTSFENQVSQQLRTSSETPDGWTLVEPGGPDTPANEEPGIVEDSQPSNADEWHDGSYLDDYARPSPLDSFEITSKSSNERSALPLSRAPGAQTTPSLDTSRPLAIDLSSPLAINPSRPSPIGSPRSDPLNQDPAEPPAAAQGDPPQLRLITSAARSTRATSGWSDRYGVVFSTAEQQPAESLGAQLSKRADRSVDVVRNLDTSTREPHAASHELPRTAAA